MFAFLAAPLLFCFAFPHPRWIVMWMLIPLITLFQGGALWDAIAGAGLMGLLGCTGYGLRRLLQRRTVT